MNILSHLQKLNDLIIEHTKPPVTAKLRNKLSLAIEQAEAHSAAVDRQEQTLATQIETIERLEKEKQALLAENAQMKDTTAKRNAWRDASEKHEERSRKLHRRDKLIHTA